MGASIEAIQGWVGEAGRIVVLTGAGISTESGIPDFRGPNGLWTRDPEAEKLSDIRHYLADPEVRRKAWQKRLANPAWTAQPNAGHNAIVALERRGKLHALITQNIDGLHQKAGNAAERVIEVHGTMHSVLCWECGERLHAIASIGVDQSERGGRRGTRSCRGQRDERCQIGKCEERLIRKGPTTGLKKKLQRARTTECERRDQHASGPPAAERDDRNRDEPAAGRHSLGEGP